MTRKETMTARERILKAINHEIPDRVPIDLGGFQTGIHKNAYDELLIYLGINDEITILDPVQQLAKPCEEVLQRFRVDTRYICTHAPDSFKGGIEQNTRDGKLWHDLKDEFGVVWSMPDDQKLFMDISYHPLADASIEDLHDYPWPKRNDPTRFTGVREETLELRKNTPYAISTGITGVVYEICWYMRGLEQWFMDMIENPSFCEALLDQILKFWMDYFYEFLPEVEDLIDAQHVLPFAEPDEIIEQVKRNLEIFKPDGGYVFNNVHNIQPGVPPENIVSLFDAGYEFGFYD